MNKDLVINQSAMLLSMFTPTAVRHIAASIADMAEDAVDLSESIQSRIVIEPLIKTIRAACEND